MLSKMVNSKKHKTVMYRQVVERDYVSLETPEMQ